MRLATIDREQFDTRMEFLAHTAGLDLLDEVTIAAAIGNPAKVIDTLKLIQKCAGEAAKFLEQKVQDDS